MDRRKLLNLVMAAVVIASLVLGTSGPAYAQKPLPPSRAEQAEKVKENRERRITQEDRKAAAERAAADGMTVEAMAEMNPALPGMTPRYYTHPNYANSPLPGTRNAVAEWNAIAQEILQPSAMDGMTMGGVSMSAAFVYLSYVQAAVYNALVAIEGGYTPYNSALATAPSDASRDAAVTAAAYGVLNHYFPAPTLDVTYTEWLGVIPDGLAKDAGIAVGEAAAAEIITLRAGDILSGSGTYVPPETPGPGDWVPTSPMPPMDPWMAVLTPFLRTNPAQYRPGPRPALNDPTYVADLAEVREVGAAMSTTRTPEQTEVARFWTTNMVIQTNASYRNLAASRDLSLLETARLMALGNMGATDSLIATFDAKYVYNFWRPVTAIQNDATNPDPSWMPAVMTPNFPEYVAGHGSFVSAQAEIYDNLGFFTSGGIDLDSSVTRTTRHFDDAAAMREEVINARTWGGLHFRNSSVLAVGMGEQLVTDALTSYFLPAASLSTHATASGGIRKFVDGLPGLDAANNLGQYIPVAAPEIVTINGEEADYYEIALVQYREKMHSDLFPTLLRGYVQVSTAAVPGQHVQLTNALLDGTEVEIAGFFGVTPPHYLGPTIIAHKNRPVRIKFYNLLPTGVDGNLFIPVDTTVMGSGMTPDGHETMGLMDPGMVDPQNPMCSDPMMKSDLVASGDCYAENRATLHLHGGITPWISDGTTHQWITPAGEDTPYPEGVSVRPVPDMDDSGNPTDGTMTFYYTNQQSARLMFYHDHAYGITRLNVYAGEAAGYLLTDAMEQALIAPGAPLADVGLGIPLIVQDKTFVPPMEQLMMQDETWDYTRWGGEGDLWLPHVYSPAQNPADAGGVNQFGRWMYGPWFWPPTTGSIDHGPIPNPHCLPTPPATYQDYVLGNWDCDDSITEGPLIPGTPFNSMGMEAFNDTPVVNGTAYPTLELEPKAYRFRVLSAANDRFFNLSWYKAVDAAGNLCDAANTVPAPESTGVACTEVLLNPAEVAAALDDGTIFPTPVVGTEGPDWWQIGTEGGFLPAPAVLPAQPTTWIVDPTFFAAGLVDKHSLLLAPAERADVVVDFSDYAGQTLILYNDAPAAFPARDPRYDYYTGSADLTDTGGAPPILPGYGPNIRTVMQVRIADSVTTPAEVSLDELTTAFKAQSLGGMGVFQNSQKPIIVGQATYNSAYDKNFRATAPRDGYARINDFFINFDTLSDVTMTQFPTQPKMIQDEMGEAFEHEYGRMSGNLGVETPQSQAGLQNMILYNFMSPPSEVIRGTDPSLAMAPITTMDDGTQIWKITHNGVDTHPIHWHLYDVQLLNRVAWDNMIFPPDANELGWKDTVRVNPLQDTIVALRPILPDVPFDLPNSIRLLDPTMPEGAYIANTTQQEALGLPIFAFDPNGEPVDIINHTVNFGWEYTWHCHILSHEEMDMMRPVVVGVAPRAPTGLTATLVGSGNSRQVNLSWNDESKNETAWVIEKSTTAIGPWAPLTTLASSTGPTLGTAQYADPIGNTNTTFFYRVKAINVVGDTWDYTDPALNEGASFPTTTMESAFSNVVGLFVRVIGPGMNLVSLPLTPASTAIQDVIGAQLTGASSELYADRIWVWDTDTQDYDYAWLIDGYMPPYNGQWWDGDPWGPSSITLEPGMGFWVQSRQTFTQTLTFVGSVLEAAEHSVEIVEGMQLIGSAYPVERTLYEATFAEDGAYGTPSQLSADRIWYWDESIQDYDYTWLIDGFGPPYDGKWWDGDPWGETTITLKPGVGYWYQRRGTGPFVWTNPGIAP